MIFILIMDKPTRISYPSFLGTEMILRTIFFFIKRIDRLCTNLQAYPQQTSYDIQCFFHHLFYLFFISLNFPNKALSKTQSFYLKKNGRLNPILPLLTKTNLY